MRGFARVIFLGGVTFLLSSGAALGFGWHARYAGYTSYYYPVAWPVAYYYPVYVAPPASCAIPVTAPSPYAVPRPAPPSSAPQTGEPPLNTTAQKPPTITEMRSPSKYPPLEDRCRVGFWNITGRDVTIRVSGQTRVLPQNRAVTLELDRDFVWQLDAREPQRQQVPEAQRTYEIILRE